MAEYRNMAEYLKAFDDHRQKTADKLDKPLLAPRREKDIARLVRGLAPAINAAVDAAVDARAAKLERRINEIEDCVRNLVQASARRGDHE